MTIAIIDYGVGNLRSVEKAFTAQGIEAVVSRDEAVLRSADKLVLLGVGAFGYAMKSLRDFGFDKLVIEAANAGKPVLGICVGLQMLFDEGHEFGVHQGLGLLPGRVIRFADGVRVPHVGWNQIEMTEQAKKNPIFCDLPDRSFFYFVHSYYVEPKNDSDVLSSTEYGSHFASVCGRRNVVGVQFHPEKSQAAGLRLIRNFAEL